MPTIVVKRKSKEQVPVLMKRFTRKVHSSGIVQHAKKRRFATRNISKTVKKDFALKLLRKKAETRKLYRLGLLKPAPSKKRK